MKPNMNVRPTEKMNLALLGVAVFALWLCPRALALRGEHGQLVSSSAWPVGLAEVVNATNRIYGYFVNADDYFFFGGDAAAFNAFLAKCVALKGTPVTMVLQSGPGQVAKFHEKEPSLTFDWKLSALNRARRREDPLFQALPGDSKYVLIVEVHVGNRMALRELKVPANVEVKTGSGASTDMLKFADDHKRKRPERP